MKCHSDAAALFDPIVCASISPHCAQQRGLSVFIQVIYIQITSVFKRRISLAVLLQLLSKAAS